MTFEYIHIPCLSLIVFRSMTSVVQVYSCKVRYCYPQIEDKYFVHLEGHILE